MQHENSTRMAGSDQPSGWMGANQDPNQCFFLTQKRLEVQLNQYSLSFLQCHLIEKENKKLLTSLQRDLLQFQLIIEKFETKLDTIHRKVSE